VNCRLLAHTPDPVAVVAAAARTVLTPQDPSGSEAPLTQERRHALVDRALSAGFTAVLRHACVTVAVDGLSFLAVHRLALRYPRIAIAASDTRRVRLDASDVADPPALQDENARKTADGALSAAASAYDELLALGVAPGDAAYVLPAAVSRGAVITADLESLSQAAEVELSASAPPEMRQLFAEIRREFNRNRALRPFASLLVSPEEEV
jgi:thymidylate synthase (FAD)